MSIIELKIAARDKKGIKGYHSMKKAELISILSSGVLPPHLEHAKKTIKQLRVEAVAKGFRYVLKHTKAELMNMLYPAATDKNPQNNDSANTHNTQHDNDPE